VTAHRIMKAIRAAKARADRAAPPPPTPAPAPAPADPPFYPTPEPAPCPHAAALAAAVAGYLRDDPDVARLLDPGGDCYVLARLAGGRVAEVSFARRPEHLSPPLPPG
jgi:hypothetical protein